MPAGKRAPARKTTKSGIRLKLDKGYGGNTPGYIPDMMRAPTSGWAKPKRPKKRGR